MKPLMSQRDFRSYLTAVPTSVLFSVAEIYCQHTIGNSARTKIATYVATGGSRHPTDKNRRQRQILDSISKRMEATT